MIMAREEECERKRNSTSSNSSPTTTWSAYQTILFHKIGVHERTGVLYGIGHKLWVAQREWFHFSKFQVLL